MKKKLLVLLLSTLSSNLFSQEKPILITEQSIIVRSGETKEIFYSLMEGDEIIFNLEMVKGKSIKEVEVVELPSNSIFTDFKTERIKNKNLKIRNKALYKFSFHNSSIAKRVCKIRLERIPENETKRNFNTNWKWKALRDTLYIPYTVDSITGYRTVKFQESKRELIKTETKEALLFNKNQRVHSYLNENGNLTSLRVDLPRPIITELREEKIISWAYWIGVGEEAQKAYIQNSETISSLATDLTTTFATPLAGIAIGTLTQLILPSTGEDVGYSFIPDYANAQKYVSNQTYMQFDTGKGIAAYGKNSNRLTGTFYIGLYNDNQIQGIDVEVKIVIIKEIKTFENKIYNKEKEEPITVILNKKKMEVKETRIRIPFE